MSEESTSSDRFVDDKKRHDDESIDFRSIIITLRKHKWPILGSTALITLLTALVVSAMTPEYRATSTLLFESNRSQTGFETPWAELEKNNLGLQTQVEVLKSRTLAERMVEDLQLREHWEYNNKLARPEAFNARGPLAPVRSMLERFASATTHRKCRQALDVVNQDHCIEANQPRQGQCRGGR